ncbi:MAG: methyltransferase [Thermoanaerobaculales bacterium]
MMTPHELEAQTHAYQASAVVLAANHLAITATLCHEPLRSEELARKLRLDVRATAVLTDALVSLGVLARSDGRLGVPEELQPLLDPASPRTVTHALEHAWHLLQRWSKLDEVVRSGQPTPRPRDDEEQLRAFILAMADMARQTGGALWDAIDLGGQRHLVDVGGGPGELALAALERFPSLSATVFDSPAVLNIAREYAAPRGLAGRIGFQTGDALHDDIPACDVALVSALVHAYGPDEVREIARHVGAGLQPGGLLLVREFLWHDAAHSGPLGAALFSVNMLGGTPSGRCYAAVELEAIFAPAGFADWRLVPLDTRSTVLIANRRVDQA